MSLFFLTSCVAKNSLEEAPCPCPKNQNVKCCETFDLCIPEHEQCPLQLIDDMRFVGENRTGGRWYAFADYDDRKFVTASVTYAVTTRVWETADGGLDLAHIDPVTEKQTVEIKEGYNALADNKGYTLDGTVEIIAPISEDIENAYGGFQMEFEERLNATGDVSTSGVPRDFSKNDSLFVGLKCTEGHQIHAGIYTKASYKDDIIFGNIFLCSGDYQEIELDLVDPQKLHDIGTTKYDPTDVFAVSIKVDNDGTPIKTQLSILGVAVDASVLELRGIEN